MNYKSIGLLAVGIFLILLCNISAEQTILEIAENESILFDQEPELMGTYYADGLKYYVVQHNNPFAGGISIYDESGAKIEDGSVAEKVIVAQQVKFDNKTIDILKNYTETVLSIDSQIEPTVNSINDLVSKIDEKVSNLDEKGKSVNYDNVETLSETLNLSKNLTSTVSSSCTAVISQIDSLEKTKDYETASAVLEEYEKCISSIDPVRSNLDKLKNQLGPASETLNSPEVLRLSLGDDELSRAISQGLDNSIKQIDELKNSSSLNDINKLNTGVLRDSLNEIKSEISKETEGFEIRINPNSRILTIIGIGILLIIIIAGIIFIRKREVEFKVKKEEEEVATGFGDITVIVTESKTRDPVLNASATLVNLKTKDKYKGTTESNGTLTLRGMAAGDYEMAVVSKKHKTERVEITIDSGANRSMVVLKRK